MTDQNSRCAQTILEKRLNMCKLRVVETNNPFIYHVLEAVRKSSNFNWTCPYRAMIYEVNNMTIQVPSAMSAPIMMAIRSKLCAEVKSFGVAKGEKNVNDFLSLGGIGHFEN